MVNLENLVPNSFVIKKSSPRPQLCVVKIIDDVSHTAIVVPFDTGREVEISFHNEFSEELSPCTWQGAVAFLERQERELAKEKTQLDLTLGERSAALDNRPFPPEQEGIRKDMAAIKDRMIEITETLAVLGRQKADIRARKSENA